MSTRRAWRQFDVALTGAFLTGQPLQIRVAQYGEVQRAIGEALKAREHGGWDYQPLKWQDVTGSYDGGGGYPSLVPLVLVTRGGDELRARAEAEQERRPTEERAWLEEIIGGWTWRLRSLTVELFDFGVGVIEGRYEVAAPPLLGVADTRRAVELVSRLKPLPDGVRSPVAACYEHIALDTVQTFAEVIARQAPAARQEPWLTPLQTALRESDGVRADTSPQLALPSSDSSDWGRLLWLHPVYLLPARQRASERQLTRVLLPFEASFSKRVALADRIFVPGIDTSAIATRGRREDPELAATSLIRLHWAYYALFMEIDRGLLATLDDDRWQRPEALDALEDDADQMFVVSMRIQETKARLASVLADLGGGALTLWDAIAEVQRFRELVAAVDAKVQNLQRLADRRLQEAATSRARRTANILGGLTALTVVTVVIALFGALIGTRADELGHIELRTAAIAAAFALALLLYRAQRERVRKRRRRERRLRRLRRRRAA